MRQTPVRMLEMDKMVERLQGAMRVKKEHLSAISIHRTWRYTNGIVQTEKCAAECEDLYNIQRDSRPSANFSVDTWKMMPATEDIHLRMTMLSAVDEVSLAEGQPPQNQPGNPKSFTYLLARREDENPESQFVSVIEAYKDQRKISGITAVKGEDGVKGGADVFAVKVTLADGRTDQSDEREVAL